MKHHQLIYLLLSVISFAFARPLFAAPYIDATYKANDFSERTDINFFLCIDSVRNHILYADNATKKCIMGLNSFEGKGEELFNLSELKPEFDGEIEYIRVLADGNYLIYEQRENACDRLWKLWPEENMMKQTFELRNIYQRLKYNWCFTYDAKHNILYMSEYGNSHTNPCNPTNPQEDLGFKADATRIWQSFNNGDTWSVFYDFKKRKDIQTDYFHIHSVFYDKYTDRLYVSSGDGWVVKNKSNKRLWWFDNGSPSPKSRDWRFYWGSTNDAHSHGQIVSFFVEKDFILAGGDDYNNGIYYISPIEGTNKMDMRICYRYNNDTRNLVTQYTSKFLKLSNGMIVSMLVNGDNDGYPRQTRLVGTFNGEEWYNLYECPVEDENKNIFNYGFFDEWKGYLYFAVTEWKDDKKQTRFIKMETSEPGNPIVYRSKSRNHSHLVDVSGRQCEPNQKGILITTDSTGHSRKILRR